MKRVFHGRRTNRPSASPPAAWSRARGLALRSPGSVVFALVPVLSMADRTQADDCYGIAEGSSGSRLTSHPCDWEDHLPVEYWRDHYHHRRQDHYYHHPGIPGCVYVYSTCGSSAATTIAEGTTAPSTSSLGANYPNPFNSATTIPVSVMAGGVDVNLTVYNLSGQPVRQLWSGPLAAGEHRLRWDGRDGDGRPVAAGVYVARLHQGRELRTRKMVRIE